jgi:hypothetical protein
MVARSSLMVFWAAVLTVSCGGKDQIATSPSSLPAISPTRPPTVEPLANFTSDAIVVSAAGDGDCRWNISPGATRSHILWRITIDGSSISLDEDLRNWPTDDVPYTGTLNGQQFTASYQTGASSNYPCQFRGGTLSGHFGPDFSTFEAEETLAWGAPGKERIVQWHWLGSRFEKTATISRRPSTD